MSLLLSMLPVYLLGNLHCVGMCGPLAMMLGKQPYRHLYFFGRILSFSLAGMVAGGIGSVLNVVLTYYHIPTLFSLAFGTLILSIGICSIFEVSYPGHKWFSQRLASTNNTLVVLLLRGGAFGTFLFGLFTVALPCGQTLFVFSTCALSGDPLVGLLNGSAFALLTSPSLWFAMHAHRLLKRIGRYYNIVMGICALIVGVLTLCRGCADFGWIDHLVLNSDYHLVIY